MTSTFAETLRQLEQRYQVVLFDTAPALAMPYVSLMLRHVGACIPVARIGRTRTRSLRQLIDLLPRDRVLGPVLNGERLAPEMSYYYAAPEMHPPPGAGEDSKGRRGKLGGWRKGSGGER